MDDFAKMAAFQAMDRGHIGNRIGDTQGANLGQVCADEPFRALDVAIDRANGILVRLAEASEAFESSLSRIMGAIPSRDGAEASLGRPNDDISRLNFQLDAMDEVALRLRNQVERLARL